MKQSKKNIFKKIFIKFSTCIFLAVSLLIASQKAVAQNNVSLETYRLIKLFEDYKLKNPQEQQKINSQYNLLSDINSSELYVKIFITFDSTFSFEALRVLGGEVGVKTSRIITSTVPVANLTKIANLPGARRVSVGETLQPNLDKALLISNINKVHSGTNLKRAYTGNGVIVGVTDWGFDFTHEMFKDQLGNSRIKRAWITHDDSGNPPEGYKGGTLYTDADYLSKILKYSSDKDNHGTHVLGISGGKKVKAQKSTYSGVAPEAELIVAELYGVTKVTAPSVNLVETVEYMFKYADSVNKPIVINMSLGTNYHPGDGSSERDIMLSELLLKDTTGKIIVASAGNSGNSYIHKLYKFNSNNNNNFSDTIAVTSLWNNNYGNRNINLYGVKPGENFSVRAEIYDRQAGISSRSIYLNTSVDVNYETQLYVGATTLPVFISTEREALNGKPHAVVSAYNMPYNYGLRVYITSPSAEVHIWNADGSTLFDSLGTGISSDNNYSIGSPGIINEIITVGAFVSRDKIESIEGIFSNAWTGKLNDIANFSSRGPRTDGVIKPDIVGAGSAIYSAYNLFYSDLTDDEYARTMVDATNSESYFISMSGTSMSSPLVTGVVALLLELNPELSSNQIKKILQATAINDSFTGSVKTSKNNIWGWGKIDALAAMKYLENSSILEEKSSDFSNILVSQNPVQSGLLTITVLDNYSTELVQLFDITGNLCYISTINTGKEITKEFNISHLSSGKYIIKIGNDTQNLLISK